MLGRVFSRHVWFDDGGLIGYCDVGDGFYRFSLVDRFRRRLVESHVVTRGSPAFSSCVTNWRTYVAKFIRRLEQRQAAGGASPEAADSVLSASYPALAEHLCVETVDDQRRVTSTLTISTDRGRWQGCLRDRDNGVVLWVSSDSFSGVLDAVERRLDGTVEGDWRLDRFASPKRRGK